MPFKGKNDIESTIELFYERADYYVNAFSQNDGNGPVQVRDFNFVEDTLYGRVDTELNTVLIDEKNLKYIPSANPNAPLRVLDFVADAFTDMVEAFKRACQNSILDVDDDYLSIPKAYRAYRSPTEMYVEYLEFLMLQFIDTHLYTLNNKKKVLNVTQFVKEFFSFVSQQSDHTPVTFTSWQRSRKSSIFTSGIAIDISNLAIDQDSFKETSFLNNPIFNFYTNMAKQYGFAISRNAPWILVADIMSPALQKYANNYIILGARSTFINKYKYAYEVDIPLLRDVLFQSYNEFVNRFYFERDVGVSCNNKTQINIKTREQLTLSQFNQKITNQFLCDFYIKMRNMEENDVLSPAQIKKLLLYSKSKNYLLDNMNFMRYINDEFRKTYKSRPGGLNSTIRKQKRIKQNTDGQGPSASFQSEESPSDTRERITAVSGMSTGGSSGGY